MVIHKKITRQDLENLNYLNTMWFINHHTHTISDIRVCYIMNRTFNRKRYSELNRDFLVKDRRIIELVNED